MFNRNGDQSLVLRGIQDLSTTSRANFSWIGHYNEENKQLNYMSTIGESYKWKQLSQSVDLAQSWLEGKQKGAAGNLYTAYNGKRLYVALSPFFVAPDFTDELGFFPFRDYRGVAGGVRLSNEWRTGIFRQGQIISGVWYTNHYDGRLFQRTFSI